MFCICWARRRTRVAISRSQGRAVQRVVPYTEVPSSSLPSSPNPKGGNATFLTAPPNTRTSPKSLLPSGASYGQHASTSADLSRPASSTPNLNVTPMSSMVNNVSNVATPPSIPSTPEERRRTGADRLSDHFVSLRSHAATSASEAAPPPNYWQALQHPEHLP